ncbi:hypothetical protein DINM_022151 [Dirofilaria immitis]|nr:hypothetical protein [Dirofilaria immitis]
MVDRRWTILSFEAGVRENGSLLFLGSNLSGHRWRSRNNCIRARDTSCIRFTRVLKHSAKTSGLLFMFMGKERSRLDEPQAAAYCPDRYSRPDLHKYEQQQQQQQQQHSKIPVSYQRRRQAHLQEISSSDSKNETTGQIRNNDCSPTQAVLNKQKLEKLSQRQRNSIFTIARAKLSSFINRLSVSSGAGCAATRILTNTSNITTANNNDLSSVISFPLRQNSHQDTIQTHPHSSTTHSFATPELLSSSVQANISLPNSTTLPNPGVSESCYSTGSISANVKNELHLAKSPVTTALLHQCNASPYSNDDDEYLHHSQKQKSATSSTSCSFFHQSNYPAAVYLTDGENSYLGMEHLVPKEESERWIRAPPNCNPFDMRASFTCSSLSCRARITQPTYGRSRLNTATGIERPSSGGAVMTIRDNGCRGRKCTEQVRSNDSLLADCRQHEDGCFSSHLRWLSMKEFSENRSQFDSRPVVYVPVLYETVCDRNIYRAVTNSLTSDESNNFISKPSSSSPSSSSLLLSQQTSTTTFPSASKFMSANAVDTLNGCTPVPVNCNSDMITHRPSKRNSAVRKKRQRRKKKRIKGREECEDLCMENGTKIVVNADVAESFGRVRWRFLFQVIDDPIRGAL